VYLSLLSGDEAPLPRQSLRRAANICRLDFQALSEVSIIASLIHAREPRGTCTPPFPRRATQVLPRSSPTRSLNSGIINVRARACAQGERKSERGPQCKQSLEGTLARIYICLPDCIISVPLSLSLSLSPSLFVFPLSHLDAVSPRRYT